MTNRNWEDYFRTALADIEQTNLRRRRVPHTEGLVAMTQWRRGEIVVNFGSNDYLGLRRDARLIEAAANALSVWGVGSGSSPLVTGYSSQLAELEQQLASWQGTEAALVFSSGMSMNIGVIAALAGPNDLVLSDQFNHASLIDGCRLSGAAKRIFPHADARAVEQLLCSEREHYQRAIVVTESVFSMDGDVAPLAELVELCERYDAGLIVDEAHASGLFGATGAGLGEQSFSGNSWLAKLGTFSKAIGTCGGFVAGSHAMIDYLIHRCRSYVYSTAISPTVVAATLAAVQLIPQLADRRMRLEDLCRRVRIDLRAQGWKIASDGTPIIPIVVGSSERALELQAKLAEMGLWVPAIRPPTVPAGAARLRISLSSLHCDQQIDHLVQAFDNLL